MYILTASAQDTPLNSSVQKTVAAALSVISFHSMLESSEVTYLYTERVCAAAGTPDLSRGRLTAAEYNVF